MKLMWNRSITISRNEVNIAQDHVNVDYILYRHATNKLRPNLPHSCDRIWTVAYMLKVVNEGTWICSVIIQER